MFIPHARGNKVVYNYFIKQKATKATVIQNWESYNNTTYSWSDIVTIAFKAVIDPKVQFFPFRYIHRILGCNNFLFKIRKRYSPLCTFWKVVRETIDHLFWSCNIITLFCKLSEKLLMLKLFILNFAFYLT